MFPYIILILLIFLYFKFKTQKIEKKINFKKYLIILTICVVSVLIWFLKYLFLDMDIHILFVF